MDPPSWETLKQALLHSCCYLLGYCVSEKVLTWILYVVRVTVSCGAWRKTWKHRSPPLQVNLQKEKVNIYIPLFVGQASAVKGYRLRNALPPRLLFGDLRVFILSPKKMHCWRYSHWSTGLREYMVSGWRGYVEGWEGHGTVGWDLSNLVTWREEGGWLVGSLIAAGYQALTNGKAEV